MAQASAAASLAARRSGAYNSVVGALSSCLRNNRLFSRSNSDSCVARNGATGTESTSNRRSVRNRVCILFVFMFSFPLAALAAKSANEKTHDCLAIVGF